MPSLRPTPTVTGELVASGMVPRVGAVPVFLPRAARVSCVSLLACGAHVPYSVGMSIAAARRSSGPPFARPGTLTRRILDVLAADGRWLTAYAIALEAQVADRSVRAILGRLVAAGYVTSRRLEQESSHQPGRVEYRWVVDPDDLDLPGVDLRWEESSPSDRGLGVICCQLCGRPLRDHGPAGTRCGVKA